MFTYSGDLKEQINLRQQKVTNKNIERINNIKTLVGASSCCNISKTLVINYIDAVEKCLDEINGNPVSTIASVVNLRFLFELCIHTRLLNKENSYKFKVYYSLYQSQLKKSESMIKYIQTDLYHLNVIEAEENKILTSTNSQEIIAKIDNLYEDVDEEIYLFLDAVAINGVGYHRHIIKKYLEKAEARNDELTEEWNKAKCSLRQNDEFKNIFGSSQQPSSIEKLLKDGRSWKNKADAVNLSEVYNIVYDYTSSLIHSNSYSTMIPNQLEKAETNMVKSLSNRLASDILKGLMVFASIPNVKVINYE